MATLCFFMAGVAVPVRIRILSILTLIQPGFRRVLLVLLVPAREQPAQVLGIAILVANQHGGVGVVLNVLVEPLVILQDVVD